MVGSDGEARCGSDKVGDMRTKDTRSKINAVKAGLATQGGQGQEAPTES